MEASIYGDGKIVVTISDQIAILLCYLGSAANNSRSCWQLEG